MPDNNQSVESLQQRIDATRRKMNNPLDQVGSAEGQAAAERLINTFAGLLGGGKKNYIGVHKSLETIGMIPKVMHVTIADEPIECLVIPMDELIVKEWKYLTGYTVPSEQEVKDDE